MDALGERFATSADSIFLYTREAHPGEKHGPHRSFEDKLASARKLIERVGVTRRVLVDDLSGRVHRAYGMLPNMTYVVRRRGRVHYRASWTDARTVEFALEQLELERAVARDGGSTLPYFMDMAPARPRDRIAFMRGLLDAGGERAVDEYVEGAASAFGEAYVEPLRAWWAEQRG
jgi:hypothetical protein